jgi:hypothetical protein
MAIDADFAAPSVAKELRDEVKAAKAWLQGSVLVLAPQALDADMRPISPEPGIDPSERTQDGGDVATQGVDNKVKFAPSSLLVWRLMCCTRGPNLRRAFALSRIRWPRPRRAFALSRYPRSLPRLCSRIWREQSVGCSSPTTMTRRTPRRSRGLRPRWLLRRRIRRSCEIGLQLSSERALPPSPRSRNPLRVGDASRREAALFRSWT